jgi:ubiquinone/menaquinone biosynthesis C-methylase UbiE
VSDSDRAYWERQAKRYDDSMRVFGGPLDRMRELCADAVGPEDRVLEVAAGTGLVTLTLARKAREVVATDYAEAMVELLGHRIRHSGLANVTCRQADLTDLPFPDQSFDVVVASNVLHLVPDINVALASLHRVLRPGGKLLVPTYCHGQSLLSRCLSRLLALTGFPGYRRLSLASLQAVVEDQGLKVLRSELIPGPLPIGFVAGIF